MSSRISIKRFQEDHIFEQMIGAEKRDGNNGSAWKCNKEISSELM